MRATRSGEKNLSNSVPKWVVTVAALKASALPVSFTCGGGGRLEKRRGEVPWLFHLF